LITFSRGGDKEFWQFCPILAKNSLFCLLVGDTTIKSIKNSPKGLKFGHKNRGKSGFILYPYRKYIILLIAAFL
jgi:hypothetical protein